MYEMQHILLPTDFSVHSDAAFEHAVLLGSQQHAAITVLHVDEFVVSALGASGVGSENIEVWRRFEQEFIEAQFERYRRAAGEKHVQLQTAVKSGRAYKVIVEESEHREYDLIVLAKRGHTRLSTALIGSTAERVVRLSRQPVLSIQDVPRTAGRIESVLCPTDLSPAGNVALAYALSIAHQSSAILYIQYISELEKPESEADIRRRLPDLKEHHPQAAEVEVEYLFDRDIEPSNSIIRFSDDRDVSLIVMSAHGKKGLRRVYIGNNTAEVVRQASRPVLTVTHPFHRRIFSRPVTQQVNATLDQKHGRTPS